MDVVLNELLSATEYRSLSRAGRNTDSVSRRTREQFRRAIILRRKLMNTTQEEGRTAFPSGAAALNEMTVSEIIDLDGESTRVQKALPPELVDEERMDPLMSSAREHPAVQVKSHYIVGLEREIAYHEAMAPFHGGVESPAVRQSAAHVAKLRCDADRAEAERRNRAFELAGTATRSSSPASRHAADGKFDDTPMTRSATPSPAFASTTHRFPSGESQRAPPVGHYRPRHAAVEIESPSPVFSRSKRPEATKAAYVGDLMTDQEHAEALAKASNRPATVTLKSHILTSSPASNGSFLGSTKTFEKTVSSDRAAAAMTLPSGSPPPAAASPTKASPSFLTPGRESPVMTRGAGGASSPQSRHSKGRARRSAATAASGSTLELPPDHLVHQRGHAPVDMRRQVGRKPPEVVGISAVNDTTTYPLRNGQSTFGTAKQHAPPHALSFDSYATRQQRNRSSEPPPESLAQRFYNTDILDEIKFRRTPKPSKFGAFVPKTEQSSSTTNTPPTHGAMVRVTSDDDKAPTDPMARHIPGFSMELSPPRQSIVLPQLPVSYDVRDDVIRPHSQMAVINMVPSKRAASMPTPASAPPLADPIAIDSSLVKRKLACDVSIERQTSREAASRVGRHASPKIDTNPDPIPAENVSRALDYIRPATKGLTPMSSVVSREARDRISAPESITQRVDVYSTVTDALHLANLQTGYVDFGRMTDRDHHGGNVFANESRLITALLAKGKAAKKSPSPHGSGSSSVVQPHK